MAESNSSSEGAPIGAQRLVVPGGVVLRKGAAVAPKIRFTAAAAPKPKAAVAAPVVARPATAVKVTGARLAPAFRLPVAATAAATEAAEKKEGEGEGVAATVAVTEKKEGEGEGAAALTPPAEEDLVTTEVQAAAEAEVAAVKEPTRALRVKHIADPPPADAPRIEPEEFMRGEEGRAIKIALGASRDAEVKPAEVEYADGKEGPAYRPITSGEFQDFMVQTYRQYSAMVKSQFVVGAGGKKTRAKKEINKEACKERDPNKTEAFYYQKFVTDYLSRDTPYRGLLVYHGLGTGKTCTSVAAAEALYWGGRKTIWVLTPATLSSNYRREIAKCGYYPLRYNNYWQFLEANAGEPQRQWLLDVLGLPDALIDQQGGGWVPDPNRPSNWDSLTDANKESIRNQIRVHMEFRFKFIHYNGVRPFTLANMAYQDMLKNTSPFDDAVIVIDEIHNLVRTINGTAIGSKKISKFMSEVEPPEFNWTMRRSRDAAPDLQGKFEYPRGYTFYRLLQNAVNTKIIALSATPMINYAQEFGILMNIVGGEQRTVEISLKGIDRSPATTNAITAWAKQHPEIDYFAIEETLNTKEQVLTLTPVPHGFVKVVDPAAAYALRGFVRKMPEEIGPAATSNERNMDGWGARLVQELESAGILAAGTGAAVTAAVTASRAAGPGAELATDRLRTKTYPLLPDDGDAFVSRFINRSTLKIMNADVLKARATGLISYYKGGSEELMPRATSENVLVPMSDYMFSKYIEARSRELEMEKPAEQKQGTAAGTRKGVEADLYAQAIKVQQTGFLALSRAACNFVFPEEIDRPVLSAKDMAKQLGIGPEGVLAADFHETVDAELNVPRASAAAALGGVAAPPPAEPEAQEGVAAAALADEAVATPPPAAADRALLDAIGPLMTRIDAKAGEFLRDGLAQFSPKYLEIMNRIRESPGPALVYSQFKTLEGLGLFAAALRASEEGYLPLDIVWNSDIAQWEIPEALMDPDRPRYILYTGDQDLDKRRLLLQLYNADVANLPPKLSEQCSLLLAGKVTGSSSSSEEASSSSSEEASSSSSSEEASSSSSEEASSSSSEEASSSSSEEASSGSSEAASSNSQAGGATSNTATTSGPDPDNRNGRICKVFMITQSGAEGISLFNTRQVHIMEPYWNNVRLEQVIGRAIRLCSHMNLPWDDRVVNVYTYLSVFSDKQKTDSASGGRAVIMADKGKTTDEQIYGIALIKKQLADGLFSIAQSAATDCKIHYFEQGEAAGVVCFEYPKGQRDRFLYHPDYNRDVPAVGPGGR
jgi:hypothetical protein